jgi:hypothetical protein
MAAPVSWGEISIAGLVGGIIGSLATHWLARWRDREKEFQDAGKQFREAFLEAEYLLSIRHPEHSKLYSGLPDEYKDAYSIVCKLHKQHYEALVRFGPYLSKSKKKKMKNAWEEYCCFDLSKNQKHATYEEYKSTENLEEQWSKRELALDRIGKMFKYTR